MEKRLPLALFLSFIVVFGWSYLFPAAPIEAEVTPLTGATAENNAPSPEERVFDDAIAPVLEASERWTEWAELGRGEERGLFWVKWDNRGGRIAELRTGDYFVRQKLTDAEKDDHENWTRLITDASTDADASLGTMLLRTGASAASKALERMPLEEVLWQHELISDPERGSGVRFTHATGTGLTITKTIRKAPNQFRFDVELSLENTNPDLAGPRQFNFTPAACVPRESTDSFYIEPQACAAWYEGRGQELQFENEERDHRGGTLFESFPPGSEDDISFAGVDNKYFAMLMREDQERRTHTMVGVSWRLAQEPGWAESHPEEAQESWRYIVTDVALRLEVPAPGEGAKVYPYKIYAGPKSNDLMVGDFKQHEKLVERDRGFFASIAGLLTAILGFFHGIFGNWGLAIIALTFTVRGVLFPINRRSQTAMARHQSKMKRIQPKLDELKEKYEKNSQKQRQEQARIMQEEGAFPPLGGCLPIFLQIPVFFGLFSALRTNFDLRQAPFYSWIEDLSQPDRLARIDFNTYLPFIGTIEYLNVLPPLMVVLWVLQQKFMPKPTDENAARMQKMMMWMPVMMGFFLYNYAAGLSLYMITTSAFGIFEMGVIKKFWPVNDTEVVKKKSGFMKRLGEMQEQAQKMQEAKQRVQKSSSGSKKPNKKKKR